MKVKELMVMLAKVNPEHEVCIRVSGPNDDFMTDEVTVAEEHAHDEDDTPFCAIDIFAPEEYGDGEHEEEGDEEEEEEESVPIASVT